MTTGRRLFPLLLPILVAACAGDGPPIRLTNAYAFEPVLGNVGAVYFTVENSGGTTDTLTGVEVAGALVAMLHEQVQDGDRMEMRHVGPLPIPVAGRVELQPGGYHVMIEGMERSPEVGDTLRVTVRFAVAGNVDINAPVVAYGTER